MQSRKNLDLVRHGDIDFKRIKKLPAGAKEIKHSGEFVVALGEVTGHKHVLREGLMAEKIYDQYGAQVKNLYTNGSFKVFEFEGDRLIQVLSATPVSHEEHRTVLLPPGLYRQEQEVEENPFADVIRKVVD